MRAPFPRWLPVLVLFAGILASTGLVVVRPGAAPPKPPPPAPAVRVMPAAFEPIRITVRAQGSLEPRTETDLVAEVAGRIEWIAPELETGARFEAGDVLLRIAEADLRIAADRAAAAVDRARYRLELAEASLARRRSLRERGAASDSALDEAVSTAGVADADLREARALHRSAQRDLERAVLLAPFDGRARELRTDVGEIAAPGGIVARLFAVDFAEVRLPIPDSELAFLELPSPGAAGAGSEVVLRGLFAGVERELVGELVGVEGALDPRTRMVTVVVRVPRPEVEEAGLPALPMGLYVEATFLGRQVDEVMELPRGALRGRDVVAVVDADERLSLRQVSVLRIDGDRVLVNAGLEAGERICTSPLDLAVDGMRVRVVQSAPST